MKPTGFCLILLAVVASAAAQSVDDIPVETDNQFPPDNNVETDTVIEGSGAGAIEDPQDITVTTEPSPPPILEDVQLPVTEDIETKAENSDDSCPKPCVCHVEGESNNFVVDCSGYDLTEFPSPIDPKTAKLNIQNNKLTEIPKDVSSLKNLKELNADNNAIMDLALGSISELPELTVLNLGNNRLIEYPQDLKNGFGLTKLQELNLGGNDMRTPLSTGIFSHFTSLKKLTLPTSPKELVDDLCAALKNNLVTVCTESCSTKLFDCPEAPQELEDGLFNAILPGTISLSSVIEDNVDPAAAEETKSDSDKVDTTEAPEVQAGDESVVESKPTEAPETNAGAEFSLRSAVNKVSEGIAPMSTFVEAPKEEDHKEADVAVKEGDVAVKEADVGATTSGSKTGGVDKSVIGMIVAGMVLVVAGITIKKNWSSIRNRFSSSPRAGIDRDGANANGAAPEEVPLQNKSPV